MCISVRNHSHILLHKIEITKGSIPTIQPFLGPVFKHFSCVMWKYFSNFVILYWIFYNLLMYKKGVMFHKNAVDFLIPSFANFNVEWWSGECSFYRYFISGELRNLFKVLRDCSQMQVTPGSRSNWYKIGNALTACEHLLDNRNDFFWQYQRQ